MGNKTFRSLLNQAIDYDDVLEQISRYASFSVSRQAICDAMPLSDLAVIQRLLEEVKECMRLQKEGIDIDFSGAGDIRETVRQASKQVLLSGSDCWKVASFLTACRNVKQGFMQTDAPLCKELAETMDPLYNLADAIYDAVDATGQIKPDASPLLKQKEKEYNHLKHQLSAYAGSFIKKHNDRLMESVSTTVSGRVCVLVKAQYKNTFGGLIHGQSQSGMAFYVEPTAFVDKNNAIQSVRLDIEEEKTRICKELTKKIGKQADTLLSDLDTLTQLDVCQAKAKWAYQKDGCTPLIQTRNRQFHFSFARHPLLDEKSVVANSYDCDEGIQCILLSGPNMGGKTVTLKTIGLFILLAHAGFPVIAHRALVPQYTRWYFDIGDQQSITNNLSTFSSHISNLAAICDQADEHSFVLLDEPGNGTDPMEGASLAQAIVEHLIQKGAMVLASTHYHAMKTFGKMHPKILVSSMEFDEKTLKPTFHYLPGISGASYAFDIAAMYHLDPAIITRAQALKEENESETDQRLEQLEAMQVDVIRQKERFDTLVADAHRLQKEAEQSRQQAQRKKDEMDYEYQNQLDSLLQEKKEEASSIIRQIRQSSDTKVHQQIEQMHKISALQEPVSEKPVQHEWKVGDYARILHLNTHGEILNLKKKEATLSANGMKLRVKLNQLEPMERPKPKSVSRSVHVKTVSSFPMELNLIGSRVEEGLRALNHYIDQAVAHHSTQVRIIHGMGTGALRQAVWKDLEKHPMVKSFSAAGANDGGLGATIVYLK
ncbi:MAG: endonuclease MutS2 [Erysipelotrichaceae bacterium]|nr:endonuclease MutS2 [Erysipelotrichaceae bacterium]